MDPSHVPASIRTGPPAQYTDSNSSHSPLYYCRTCRLRPHSLPGPDTRSRDYRGENSHPCLLSESTPGLCCPARETGSPGPCPQCIHPLLGAGTGYQRMLPGSETRSKGWAGISGALCGLGSMGPEKSVWLEFWEPAAYASCHSLMKPAGNSRNPRQWSRGSVVRLNEATFENAQHGILPRAPGRGSQTTPPLLTQEGGHG